MPKNMSPEQYKLEVMKNRIAALTANYEDIISSQATNIAELQDVVESLESKLEQLSAASELEAADGVELLELEA